MSYLTDIDLEEIVDLVTKKQPTWHTTERSWWKAANLMNNQIYNFFPFVVFFLNRCLFLRSAILKLANFFFPTIYCWKITRLKQKVIVRVLKQSNKILGQFCFMWKMFVTVYAIRPTLETETQHKHCCSLCYELLLFRLKVYLRLCELVLMAADLVKLRN